MTTELDHVGNLAQTLHWRIKKQLVFFYEVPTDLVVPILPAQLEAQEVRPGVTICCLEVLHYKVGHFEEGYREFFEAVFAVTVHPDLSIDMPMPRFNMFAMRVISDSREFCHSEAKTIFTPTNHVPGFRIEFDELGTSCVLYDGDQVICECKNTSPDAPMKPTTIWGQYFTNTQGLQRGAWRWDGYASEHMKPGADTGKIYPHMLFAGIDPSKIGRVYRQMVAKPDQTDIRFYHAGPFGQPPVATYADRSA